MKKTCPDCSGRAECRYGSLGVYLFEAPADHPFIASNAEALGRISTNLPPPFILNPPPGGTYSPGELILLQFTLVGQSIAYFPFFACALEQIKHLNMGKGRGKLRLIAVTDALINQEDEAVVYSGHTGSFVGPAEVINFDHIQKWVRESLETQSRYMAITFQTPMKFKYKNGKGRHLSFEIFMRNVLRRLSLLSVHCPNIFTPDYKNLLQQADSVMTQESTLKWFEWERYSSRQKKKIIMGGLMGKIIFSGEIQSFIPFVRICEFLNVGKSCSFGMGGYRFELW